VVEVVVGIVVGIAIKWVRHLSTHPLLELLEFLSGYILVYRLKRMVGCLRT